MTNDVKLEIRLPKALKAEFIKVCTDEDMKSSQILRRCIREYVKKYKEENAKKK